jgi:dienelactone hydrolase
MNIERSNAKIYFMNVKKIDWNYGELWTTLIFFICFNQKVNAQADPFTAYINNVPEIIKTISKTDSASGDNAITTTKFLFASRDKINTVYAIMAKPQQAGPHPAILFLHGGGSRAEDLFRLVEEYAMRGYVTLSLDLPGICNTAKAINSDGPWKTKPGGETPRFDIAGGPENSTLADAEIAGLEAFNLLRSQPDVDVKNIGITGFSWGGYSTTILSGLLGRKVKAAYAVFGCGYYDKGSFWKDIIAKMGKDDRNVWLKYFDAGRRSSNIKAAYFLDAASNDTYFWPEAVGATLNEIRNNKNHVWNPNLNHRQSVHGIPMQKLYFDHYLKGIGGDFGKIIIRKIKMQTDSSKKVFIRLELPEGVQKDSVILYYSEQGVNWQARTWVPVNAVIENNNNFVATLPADKVKKGINFYAYLLDNRGVTTSSDMY